jgi:hypothetical protein
MVYLVPTLGHKAALCPMSHACVSQQCLMLEDKKFAEMCRRTILNHVDYMTDPIFENVSVSTTLDMV